MVPRGVLRPCRACTSHCWRCRQVATGRLERDSPALGSPFGLLGRATRSRTQRRRLEGRPRAPHPSACNPRLEWDSDTLPGTAVLQGAGAGGLPFHTSSPSAAWVPRNWRAGNRMRNRESCVAGRQNLARSDACFDGTTTTFLWPTGVKPLSQNGAVKCWWHAALTGCAVCSKQRGLSTTVRAGGAGTSTLQMIVNARRGAVLILVADSNVRRVGLCGRAVAYPKVLAFTPMLVYTALPLSRNLLRAPPLRHTADVAMARRCCSCCG